MSLLPCQRLMAATFEEYVENNQQIHLYTCKSGNVFAKICGDPTHILCDVIEKTCREKCPAIKEVEQL